MKFDSKDTEEYYYSKLKELRIGHISVTRDKIYSMSDIIEILSELECIIKLN